MMGTIGCAQVHGFVRLRMLAIAYMKKALTEQWPTSQPFVGYFLQRVARLPLMYSLCNND